MSDQQEVSSDLGSDGPQQQRLVQVEGLDSIKIKVTNLVDGFFRYASGRSASPNPSSSQADMSDSQSGRGSPRRPASPSFLMPGGSTVKPKPIRPKPMRKLSTKKVKFKEEEARKSQRDNETSTDTPDSNDSPTARPASEPLNADYQASRIYMDESSWNLPTRRRLSSEDSYRKSKDEASDGRKKQRSSRKGLKRDKGSDDERDNMDASTSSQASWNVHLSSSARPGGTEARLGMSSPFGSLAQSTATDLGYKSLEDEPQEPMWFEQYMPNWVNVTRSYCGSVVLDDRFQILMVVLILANAVCMGLATFDFIDGNPHTRWVFEQIDQAFLIVFTVELALQFGYWGYQLFFDGWLLFDFITVVSSWLLDGVQVFRSFRIFRAFRLVVRIPILKSLVYAVLHVLPRISSIMGLFSLIIYIFAVMTTTLYKDYHELDYTDANYFGRLDYSLFTLFQFVTLEGWADIVRQVGAHDPFAYFIFNVFLTISGFILYSLVVAVVCDSFLAVEAKIRLELKEQAKQERERRKSLKRRKSKRNLLEDTSGWDDSGVFTLEHDDSEPQSDNEERDDLDRRLMMSRNHLSESQKLSFIRRQEHQPELPVASATPIPPPVQPSKPAESPTVKRKKTPPQASHANNRGIPPPLATPTRATPPPSSVPARALVRPNTNELNQSGDDFTDEEGQSKTVSATAATTAKTLASGELERKKRGSSKRKKKAVKQRIKRVRNRLDKLTKAQAEILDALDDMCKEMEKRNGISDD